MKKGANQREKAIDVEGVFDRNQAILKSHNASGAKVLLLLVQQAGGTDVNFAEIHAAYGLGLAFCYVRGDYHPIFHAQEGLLDRASYLLGYEFESCWPHSPEEAWDFIRRCIDERSPVKMTGGEHSIVFAYADSDDMSGRYLQARGVGGPSLQGKVEWDKLVSHGAHYFRPLPGFDLYRVLRRTQRPSARECAKVLANRTLRWQTNHPATRFMGTPENYGISGFERYYKDLLDPDVGVPDEYLGCIGINFQRNARSYIADHLTHLASGCGVAPLAKLLNETAANYRIVAEKLDTFVTQELGKKRTQADGQEAIKSVVGDALEAEKRVIGGMEAMVKLLG